MFSLKLWILAQLKAIADRFASGVLIPQNGGTGQALAAYAKTGVLVDAKVDSATGWYYEKYIMPDNAKRFVAYKQHNYGAVVASTAQVGGFYTIVLAKPKLPSNLTATRMLTLGAYDDRWVLCCGVGSSAYFLASATSSPSPLFVDFMAYGTWT